MTSRFSSHLIIGSPGVTSPVEALPRGLIEPQQSADSECQAERSRREASSVRMAMVGLSSVVSPIVGSQLLLEGGPSVILEERQIFRSRRFFTKLRPMPSNTVLFKTMEGEYS